MSVALEPLKPLDMPYEPWVSGGGELLFQTDNAVVLSFMGRRRSEDDSTESTGSRDEGRVIMKFACTQSKFGYPNEEPIWRNPRYEAYNKLDLPDFKNCFEVMNNDWEEQLKCENSHAFPTETHRDGKRLSDDVSYSLRHFIFFFKETTAEILARDYSYKCVPHGWGHLSEELKTEFER